MSQKKLPFLDSLRSPIETITTGYQELNQKLKGNISTLVLLSLLSRATPSANAQQHMPHDSLGLTAVASTKNTLHETLDQKIGFTKDWSYFVTPDLYKKAHPELGVGHIPAVVIEDYAQFFLALEDQGYDPEGIFRVYVSWSSTHSNQQFDQFVRHIQTKYSMGNFETVDVYQERQQQRQQKELRKQQSTYSLQQKKHHKHQKQEQEQQQQQTDGYKTEEITTNAINNTKHDTKDALDSLEMQFFEENYRKAQAACVLYGTFREEIYIAWIKQRETGTCTRTDLQKIIIHFNKHFPNYPVSKQYKIVTYAIDLITGSEDFRQELIPFADITLTQVLGEDISVPFSLLSHPVRYNKNGTGTCTILARQTLFANIDDDTKKAFINTNVRGGANTQCMKNNLESQAPDVLANITHPDFSYLSNNLANNSYTDDGACVKNEKWQSIVPNKEKLLIPKDSVSLDNFSGLISDIEKDGKPFAIPDGTLAVINTTSTNSATIGKRKAAGYGHVIAGVVYAGELFVVDYHYHSGVVARDKLIPFSVYAQGCKNFSKGRRSVLAITFFAGKQKDQ